MRNSLIRYTQPASFAVASAAAIVVLGLAVTPAAGQTFPAYKAPRMADGHPDLNGIWQAFVTADFDLQDHEAKAGPHPELMGAYAAEPAGMSIVEGGEIPYKPEALAKKKQNFERRMMVDVSSDKKWHELGDPELKCYMPGVPRANYMPFPFRIVQGSSPYILIAYEFATATRTIGRARRPRHLGWAGRGGTGKAIPWWWT